MRTMSHADYLRRQAETLVHLSRATFDLALAGRLRALAAELQARAAQMRDEPAEFSPLTLHTGAPAVGDLDRR
ncbi:MAG TPA: hypothetical protein VH678_06600 [Xanthobacteraceae bacterium]